MAKAPKRKSRKGGRKPAAKAGEATPTVTTKTFTTTLQLRHAAWVERSAKLYRDTPDHIIEQCVRRACGADHEKAGLFEFTTEHGTIPADKMSDGSE